MSEPRLDGYIKLHKKLLSSSIWKSRSSALKVIAVTCLLKANFKDTCWNNLIIKRGSFITSQRKLAQECNINRGTLRHCLHTLKETHFLTQEYTHYFSIITICNYESYQTKKYIPDPLNGPETHPQTDPHWPKQGPSVSPNSATGGLNKGHNIINNNKKEDSEADFVCKDCQYYDQKKRTCILLLCALPPFTKANGCENFKPKESEVKA